MKKTEANHVDDLTFFSMLSVLQSGMWLLNDIESFLKQFDLSHGRFSILLAMKQSSDGSAISQQLAVMLGKSKPTITRMVGKLQAGGFVTVTGDNDDGRKKRLVLTAKARALLAKIVPQYNQRIRKMSAGLTHKDKRDLLRILSKVNFLDPLKKITTNSGDSP